MKNLLVFDLDDTLFNLDHRAHLVETKPAQWDAFFNACDGDTYIPEMLDALLTIKNNTDTDILFLTGRSDVLDVRRKTLTQLALHQLDGHTLVLRRKGDFRKSGVYKLTEIERRMKKNNYEKIVIVDDDSNVIQACGHLGHTVHVTAPYDHTAKKLLDLFNLSVDNSNDLAL